MSTLAGSSDYEDFNEWAAQMEGGLIEEKMPEIVPTHNPLESLDGHVELYYRIVEYAGATTKVAGVCSKMQEIVEHHLKKRSTARLQILLGRGIAERVEASMVRRARRRCTPQYKTCFRRVVSNTQQLLKEKNLTNLQPQPQP